MGPKRKSVGAIYMSVLGQKQTLGKGRVMSALPPKADMDQSGCDVRFVPLADIERGFPTTALSDRIVQVEDVNALAA